MKDDRESFCAESQTPEDWSSERDTPAALERGYTGYLEFQESASARRLAPPHTTSPRPPLSRCHRVDPAVGDVGQRLFKPPSTLRLSHRTSTLPRRNAQAGDVFSLRALSAPPNLQLLSAANPQRKTLKAASRKATAGSRNKVEERDTDQAEWKKKGERSGVGMIKQSTMLVVLSSCGLRKHRTVSPSAVDVLPIRE